ncbi:uncharacterized protein LOC126843972 isoform X2 [Adelges cooleyi]|uniref:uncharacterized protein LOC126843972 isoform X1 n=1 Tax=Adelges cooleyi TaxID=133065 RepID=UPI0021808148|nr:uncharacterized protein LOC126843972 isoform X1 [Adelges cooleyi]XP_050437741.1 uncharacterized protein LOC126843972 isoform X2 [Adelges cooleyi]
MKVFYVLMICSFIYVFATDDDPADRKVLDTTNILIYKHIDRNTIRNKIKHFAYRRNEFSMKELTFMFAIPEQNIDGDPIIQHALEIQLQQGVLQDSGYTNEQATHEASDRISVFGLGEQRRDLLKPSLALLIIDIMMNPDYHGIDFVFTCRIIGLFMSTKFPTSYTKTAMVLPDDTCVIGHGSDGIKSYAYQGKYIHRVNNEDHSDVGKTINHELW